MAIPTLNVPLHQPKRRAPTLLLACRMLQAVVLHSNVTRLWQSHVHRPGKAHFEAFVSHTLAFASISCAQNMCSTIIDF